MVRHDFITFVEAQGKQMGFTTTQGSFYAMDELGRTTRTKTLHPGHDRADVGIKTISDKTIYVRPEDAQRIGMHNSLNREARAMILLIQNHILLISWNELELRWGKYGTPIPYSEKASIGMSPVELWGLSDGFGGLVPKKNHPGNPIVSFQF